MDQDQFNQCFLDLLHMDMSSSDFQQQMGSIIHNVNNLRFIFDFLPHCPMQMNELTLTFYAITQILKNRGGLLDGNFLQEQINFLMSFITGIAQNIVSQQGLVNACADAVGYSYRFIFELAQPDPPPFTSLFELLNNPDDSIKNLSLEIMNSVVVAIKEKLKHLTDVEQQKILNSFQQKQLPEYFVKAASIVLSNHPRLIDNGLKLLVSCFQNFAYKMDSKEIVSIDNYFFPAPQNLFIFYQKEDLPRTLFQIFSTSPPDSPKQSNAMESLIYFTSVTWKEFNISFQRPFIDFAATSITNLIMEKKCQTAQKTLLVSSRFIFKLGTIINVNVMQFLDGSSAISNNFFMAVRDLTIFSFQNFLFDEPSNYFIKFWGRLAGPRYGMQVSSLPVEFVNLFPQIFQSYIESLINYDFDDENSTEIAQFIESIKFLWSVVSMSPGRCSSLVASTLSNLTQQLLSRQPDDVSVAILNRISFIIHIITAQFVGRLTASNRDDHIILIDALLNFINLTNDYIKSIASNNQMVSPLSDALAKVETAIQFFTDHFKRDFLYASNNIANYIYSNLPIFNEIALEFRKQRAFDIIFNRFLNDFYNFKSKPSLLLELIKFIDEFIQKSPKEVKQLVQNNELLQSLIQRKFVLEFEGEEIYQVSKLYTTLNKLYVRSIQTVDQWSTFLPYFDHKFNQLRENGFTDSPNVFILFSEINGVLKGNGVTNLFYFLFRWFMTHINDILACIERYRENTGIITTICKAWTSLSTNKGNKLVIPNTSSEGIKLFRSSMEIIEKLSQGDLSNPDNASIRMKYISKIIAPSLTMKYVNFGIMKYFKDNSYDQMIDRYFWILTNWPFEVYSQFDKIVQRMNSIILSIIAIEPTKIADDAKLSLISQFLFKAMLHNNNALYIKEIYQTLTKLFEFFLSINSAQYIANFQPHFLAILDQIINNSQTSIDIAAGPLCYMILGNREYANHVFEQFCNLFDQKSKEELDNLFRVTFNVEVNEQKSIQIAQKELRTRLINFKKRILRYATNLSDIPEFENFFRFL